MKYKLLRFSLMCILAMLGGVVYADYYQKVTSATDITNGDYLIVYEEGSVAFNGGLTTLDAVSNTVAVTIEDGKIASSETVDAATFTIASTDDGYTVRSASGNYIGQTSYANGLKQNSALASGYYHTIGIDGGNAVLKITTSGGDVTLRYNKASDQNRFRFFKSGQQAIQLYKKVAESSDTRIATTLTLGEYQSIGEVDGSMSLPTATVMAGETEVTGASIVWESSNTNVATIGDGKINFIAAGTTKITAAYSGDETNYKASTASFDLTVTPAKVTISSFTTLQEKATGNSTPATITFNGEKVVYVNGSNAYLADTNGFGALLYTKNHGLEVGQTLTGTIDAAIQLYQGAAEITNFTKEGLTIGTAAVSPAEKTIGEVVKANQSTLVTLKNVIASVSSDGKTITLSDGEKTITYFDKFKTNVAIGDGKTYDVTGVVVLFNDVIEICPRTADDVVEATAEQPAGFRDFAVQLTNSSVFDTNVNNFGVKVAEDGTYIATTTDDASANFTVSAARFNDGQHGWVNCTFTVPVEGPVLVKLGDCQFGAQTGTITDGTGAVTELTKPAKKCWDPNAPDQNVVASYYRGLEPTTLTISYTGYCPFISVTAVDPADLPAEVTNSTVTFDITDVSCVGVAPSELTIAQGETLTIPTNYTLYKEGYTLTGWSDGKNTYSVGGNVTVSQNMTLTPVFTQNTVNLADRTEPVTVKWNFRRDQGAPAVGWEKEAGHVWVAQAEVNGMTIDVALPLSTSPGKFNNNSHTDWVQINSGTTFTVPSCKGATISTEAFSDITTTTIDGQSDYTSGKTISYTVASSAESVDVVIGDGSYYRYIQVVLPVVESQGGGTTYENKEVSVMWPIEDKDHAEEHTTENADLFSVISANYGDLTLGKSEFITDEKGESTGVKGTFFRQGEGSTKTLQWSVKPVAGLTFTPTKVSGYVNRDGTDVENGLTVSVVADGETTKLGTWTALRRTKTSSQKPYDATAIYKFEVELTEAQQTAMATSGEFTLVSTLPVTNPAKDGVFGNVVIEGFINGTAASVNKYTLVTAAAPAEGGSVSAYPAADEYEEGSTIKLTATENFGYDFVNWTNADDEVVSTDAVYMFDIAKDEILTANFQAVETYELALTVDGTNDYMVTIDPAPTMVDGKMMYEAGTAVQLTANSYEGLVTFNNWSDGETSSSKLISMTDDTELTALYSQTDIIAGWDFYKKGNEGRQADFASEDNGSAALTLVNTETGATSGWLDKSTEAANGYESFKGAAVNWRQGASNGDVGNYHWQTKVNAKDFTDINVQFQMLYNYNAYQTYNAEYSLDGETWINFGSLTMTGVKVPISFNGLLPDDCNNHAEVYIRMIADMTSNIDGTVSANDGNTLAMFFITGTQALVDDGKAPELVSTVPADEATGVSASGKVVLTFDEKVMVSSDAAATLGSLTLTPIVSGKTISFEYKGLEYSTEYTFTLPVYTVSDLTNNAIDVPITFSFTTMERPTVDKKLYDFIVPDDGTFAEALKAAAARSDQNVRYRIFVKQGNYVIPANQNVLVTASGDHGDGNQYADPKTTFNSPNVSIIGESADNTAITNEMPNALKDGQNVLEGIRTSGVLYLESNATDTYFQDLKLHTTTADGTGRNVILVDKGTRNVFKNVTLWAYQDTYVPDNGRGLFYFENGIIRGRTDFICGDGDVFFNTVDIIMCEDGGYITAARGNSHYGYVFKDCTIKGGTSKVNGNYYLGRPWTGGAETYFINTTMEALPRAEGWHDWGQGPTRYAEFNSMTSSGTPVDLSQRMKLFPSNSTTNNPVLTAEEALEIGDPHNTFGDWDPTLATEQAPVPQNVKQEGNNLVWDNSNYALLWAIVKDGAVIDFTTEPTYELTESGTYAVRAANEMGGLSEASESVVATVAEVVKVTLNASGYATLASAKALDFSAVEGLTAYIVKEQTADKAILTSVTATPAETGLVLKGEAGAEYNIPVATSATSIEGNLLVAAVNSATVDAKSVYVLDGDKFKVFTGTEIPAGKAYLPMNGNARLLELVFSDATAIGSVNVDVNANQIYDLQGRRVKTPSKGVYVVDGKKVIIK